MLLHKGPLISIYFGDCRKQFIPTHFANKVDSIQLLNHTPFNHVQKVMKLKQLFFLHQVHSTQGLCIVSKEQIKPINCFSEDGDFLITALPGLGLGVATADCLPIILYDSFNQVVGIVHAGWRGTAAKVVVTAVERMQKLYSTNVQNLTAFFGPSARACCYTITDELFAQLEHFPYLNDVIQKHGDHYTLDVPLLNRLQLEEIGVKKDAMHVTYNACTMCDTSFCSYRRQGQRAERQMTVVVLNT